MAALVLMLSADSPRVTQAPAGVSMQPTGKQPSDGGVTPLLKSENGSSANLFWICLVPWAISFLLPAARYQDWGQEKTMFGWEAAYTALILPFVPVKGTWFGFDPHVWSAFANFFMLWAPFRIKRLKKTKGRIFAVAFMIAAFVPVGLLFIPESLDLATIRAFEVGFVLWALAIIGASAWFSWSVWGKRMALLPNIVLAPGCSPDYSSGLRLYKGANTAPSRNANRL